MDVLYFILFAMFLFGMFFSIGSFYELYDDSGDDCAFWKLCILFPFSLSIYIWSYTENNINKIGRIIVLIFTTLFVLPYSLVVLVISSILLICYFIGKIYIKIFEKKNKT